MKNSGLNLAQAIGFFMLYISSAKVVTLNLVFKNIPLFHPLSNLWRHILSSFGFKALRENIKQFKELPIRESFK